ncbi:hypothetical protein CBM2589_B10302 [Cupriavidus taiwanensis]|uniref:Uncharacterized protein n=1 Tax=Cupriavidus taiwanensis TaxID=164546 RepID=A0A975WNZ6_9BURK|nr:hypothetical protein [Cupriavidus taiwanensis]SOY40021.1 hypothetical protein CBM2589_B10302 [Cupriavidus taiwanensis]
MYEQNLVQTRAVSTGNPVLDVVKPIPTRAAAKEIFRQGFKSTPEALEALKQSQGGVLYRPIVSADAQEALLIQVVSLVHAGLRQRNLLAKGNAELFRLSLAVARQAPNVQGHRRPREVVVLEGALPRGILFVTSARMGRRVTAERIAQYLGTDPVPIEVMTPTGKILHWHLPVLRVNWAGSLDDFLAMFLITFGAAMRQGDLRAEVRIDRNQIAAEALAIMVGFCLGANLGLLIVERINTREAEPKSAVPVWSLLGQFTRHTGIPVLSMATPGGAAGLMRESSASGELSGRPITMNPPSRDSAVWAEVCTYAYQELLRGTGDAPAWLVEELGTQTQSRFSLAIKCCVALANHYGQGDAIWSEAPAGFEKVVKAALFTEEASLAIAKRLANGVRGYTRGSLLRHADWIQVGDAKNLVLGLSVDTAAGSPLPPQIEE